MANEITVQASLTYAKAGIKTVTRTNFTSGGDVFDQLGSRLYVNRVQNIGTSAEAIGLGDVATPGWCWMQNIGAFVIFIRMGVGGANVVKLKAKDLALFRLAANNPFAIAIGTASDLEYFILED